MKQDQDEEKRQFAHARKWAIRSLLVGIISLSSLLLWYTFMVDASRTTLEAIKAKNQNLTPVTNAAEKYIILPVHPLPENKFLQQALSIDPVTQGYRASSWSDTAYLDHCNFQDVDWNDVYDFTSIAMPRNLTNFPKTRTRFDGRHEMKLELLEIYASNHSRFCDYALYKPTVRREADPEQAAAILRNVLHVDTSTIRLAIVIVAYKDIQHLKLLLKGVHLPQHYIIIHLERYTNPDFEKGVRELAVEYENVVVLKFGSIVYKTGQVTDINLRIMRWLVFDSGLTFSYFLALGGAVYPLYSAMELAQALQLSGRKVFMGEIANDFAKNISIEHFGRIALTYSRQKSKEYPLKASKSRADLDLPMRPEIMELFNKKSNSGNQGIFDYATVKALLESVDAMEVMASSKYGCCCCLEELVWYGSMKAIGLAEEALATGSMLQFWSGLPGCEYTMSNSLLKVDNTSCYLLGERNARFTWKIGRVYGPELQHYLVEAKKMGFLFARKFDSTNTGSVKLRTWIRKYLQPLMVGPYTNQERRYNITT